MTNYYFDGEIPSSKSILNRLLIVQSYFTDLKIKGDSNCSDVRCLKSAILSFQKKKSADCGDSATGFRFLAIRASREPGQHFITGSERLLSRPHGELLDLLRQLGVSASFDKRGLMIEGKGWVLPESGVILVGRSISSQFASAIAVNAWNLPRPLRLQYTGERISEFYLDLTLEVLRDLGMKIVETSTGIEISEYQRPQVMEYEAELDISSAFTIAAAGALAGEVQIRNFVSHSRQPDIFFITILQQMGVEIFAGGPRGNNLSVKFCPKIKEGSWNLGNSPDLFPVLATLCSFAEGKSTLHGAPQLTYKESNRILKTAELLRGSGCLVEPQKDGMVIWGDPMRPRQKFDFDPDKDHRLAMAAGLLILKNFPIKLMDSSVVDKSFPEFWQCLGINHGE